MPSTLISPSNMTSDAAPAPYVAAASTNYPADGFLPWNAFDGTLGVPGWTGTNHGVDSLQIYLGAAALLGSYAIVIASAGREPTAWTMQGSNDGSIWITLDVCGARCACASESPAREHRL
jgi:hypothetical protein